MEFNVRVLVKNYVLKMSKRKDSQITKVERKIKKYKKMVDNLRKEEMCDEMEKEENAIDLATFKTKRIYHSILR